MGSAEGSWIRRHNQLKPAHTRSDRCSAADPWRLSPRIQMHDIYSWLVRRYDDSHQMLESARSWRFFGWPLLAVGLIPLVFVTMLASSERTRPLELLLQAIPSWTLLGASGLFVTGLYMVAYSILLGAAARWARKAGHF